MGGCATKPKTLKGEEESAPAPAPAPEPVKEDTEAREVAVVGEEEKLASHEQGAEIQVEERVIDKAEVGDDAVKPDDTTNKPRSLGNLFKEGEGEKESSGKDETTQKEPNTETITKEAKAEEPATTPAAEVKSAVPVAPAAEEKSTLPVAPAAEEKSTIPVAPVAETIEEEKTVIAATTNIQQEKTETEEEKRTEEDKGVVAKDVQVTKA